MTFFVKKKFLSDVLSEIHLVQVTLNLPDNPFWFKKIIYRPGVSFLIKSKL